MTAVSITSHPIRLLRLNFPKTAFERRNVKSNEGEPLLFPRFDLEVQRTLDLEERRIDLTLKVKSRPGPKAIVKFSFEVKAVFECTEFVQTTEALIQFAPSAAMLHIAWPYVRPYLTEQMTMLGLPPYHLPLVIKWKEQEPVEGGLPGATAHVEESRQEQ